MPQFCAVLNCGSNSLRDKVSFFRFPSSTDSYKINLVKKERREEWIKALKRTDLTESKLKNQRVCERHFITGKPASLEEREHPDWIPSLHLGHDSTEPQEPTEREESHTSPPADPNSYLLTPSILFEHSYCLLPPGLQAKMSSLYVSTPEEEKAPPVAMETDQQVPAEPPEEAAKEEQVSAAPVSPEPPAPPTPPVTPPALDEPVIPPVVEPEPPALPAKEEPPEEVAEVEVKEEAAEATQPEVVEEQPQTEVKTEAEEKPVKEEVKDEPTVPAEGEDSVTRCICGFEHDDGFMISCDKCLVWQHVDCMEIERAKIPDDYLCELCQPRKVDRARAVSLQRSKKKLFDEMLKSSAADTPPSSSDLSNSDGENAGGKVNRRKRERRKEQVPKKKKPPKPATNIKKSKPPKREIKTPKKEEPENQEEGEDSGEEEETDLRSWIDAYEEAITNHYSPELRARVSVLKANGIGTDDRFIGAHSAKPKSKVVSMHGQKILVAKCNIAPGQPIIEIRGKYMLPKGGSSPPQNGKSREQFVFHHKIPGPGPLATEVHVDTSTYGNCARFTRSSCESNVEMRHCIEKGTLHLYLVSSAPIEPKQELVLPHRPGVPCALGQKCSLLSGKRRNRKQILVERSFSRESAIINNNYKESPTPRKRSSSSERPVSSKALKTSSNNVPSLDREPASTGRSIRGKVTLRSAITTTTQSRRSESKYRGVHFTKREVS